MNSDSSVFQTVFYLRLSKEDHKKRESDSISNQRLILQNFITSHPEFHFVREYIDDGETGTNFSRPGFSKMMEDLDHHLFNCILCKDCSRFGRDYIAFGSYIRSFDQSGIRFIAVHDQYDSFDKNRDDTLFAIKNVINTEYSRNKSKDLKKLFKEKQYEGEYMGAFCVYGYQKDPENKHHFIIDPYASHIVQRIFSLFCGGMKKQSIARLLTKENIPSPEEYKRASGSNFSTGQDNKKRGWGYGTIHSILNNPVYIGNMVQNKTYRKCMKGRAYKNPPEKWIIKEHTHEPIISEKIWKKTQRLLKENSQKSPDFSPSSVFSGFLKCADCGASLSSGRWGKQSVFLCGTYKRFGRSHCTPHLVPKQLLYDTILEDLNRFFPTTPEFWAALKDDFFFSSKYSPSEKIIAQLENRLSKISAYKKKAFELYSDHQLSLSDFQSLQNQYETQISDLCNMKKELFSSSATSDDIWIDEFFHSRKLSILDRSIIADVISSIVVTESKEIQILYRF